MDAACACGGGGGGSGGEGKGSRSGSMYESTLAWKESGLEIRRTGEDVREGGGVLGRDR